ncbi:MAG: aminotransferase class V-fold PLP-dependent enzyme [Anaerolineae bacterium]|nr:aminotransferase class V-fold PLP-dependent enzyme [Anaerolineae bacterium]
MNEYSVVVKEPGLPEACSEAWGELEASVEAALETYSNVHRGSGHNSMVSTHLYERARDIVLEHLGLSRERYTVIFSTPRRAHLLTVRLKPTSYHIVSSDDLGLPLGVMALAVERRRLPGGAPFQPGGGTARLVFPSRTIWARGAEKFESGTPAIVNVIAFVSALRLTRCFESDAFQAAPAAQTAGAEEHTAASILYQDELDPFTGRELLERLQLTLIGCGVQVPTADGTRPYINLDNAASTPTFAPIWQAVRQAWREPRRVQEAIVHAVKAICARVLGAPPDEYDVLFTSNTTESINLVAESLGREREQGVKPLVVNTLLEHNSNELPWRTVPGASSIRFPVDAEGFVDLVALEALLRAHNQERRHGKKRVKLVAVSGASNVLGVYNDLAEICRIVHRYGARLLVDAAQLVAHRAVDVEACGIDYLAFSAHKVYAPFGTGVLVARRGLLHFDPAELESIRVSGEENVAGIAALGKALVLLQRIGFDVIQEEEQALTARALRGLAQIPGVEVFGIKDPASPRFGQKGGVIVFRVKGLMADGVARQLAERGGIGTRYGCHCAHLLIKHLLKIHPLLAQFQGVVVSLFPQISLPGLTRISLGIQNNAEEIDTLLQMLAEITRHPHTNAENPFARTQTTGQKKMDEFARVAARRVYGE